MAGIRGSNRVRGKAVVPGGHDGQRQRISLVWLSPWGTGDDVRLLDPDTVTLVVIHITVSQYGDVEEITRWHKRMGYEACGYHFLILNTFPTYSRWITKQPDPWSDGKSMPGRQLMYQGAHVRGYNDHSVGIALVGERGQFSSAQLRTAVNLCRDMKHRFPHVTEIKGHTELDPKKTCPDLDMDLFRFWVAGGWA